MCFLVSSCFILKSLLLPNDPKSVKMHQLSAEEKQGEAEDREQICSW